MCQHCGRRVETDLREPYTCFAEIDRKAWAALPKAPNESGPRRPHPKYVQKVAGKELCVGTMYPIEEYA